MAHPGQLGSKDLAVQLGELDGEAFLALFEVGH